ncbi:DUF3078 domain-containing protein [Pseudoflavitalea sp. G-6-1-2]|uniref:DUF3078 domain-containing protein n=1 Tax=Pseudoflavitalea sp. G-6-1-2 TaxID=2728841 RepID=UPI00146B0DAA|nr:DUF3078 domain-containing protein [Pseudoflavitalea sp. G-6-1-2]NML20436.1 DUF3078 domain-containing protein [Pseudoflavitalea sp. G-6-1-2]
MMRKILLFCACTLSLYSLKAQTPSVKEMKAATEKPVAIDTAHKAGWRKGGLFSLNFGQGSSKNWAAGAEKFSFTVASTMNLFANYRDGKFYWNNTLDLGYAIVNTTSLGSRKTDDKIDYFGKVGHDLTKTLSLSGVVNFRSQFTDGFDYTYLGKDTYKRKTSSFFAPAYLIVAPGLDWHPVPYFSLFVSPISARMVFVTNPWSYYFPDGVIPPGDGGGFEKPLATLYGVDPNQKVRTELGGFASANFVKEVVKNVTFKSRLDLYSNYLSTYRYTPIGTRQVLKEKLKAKPQNIDVFWTNLISMKVNKFLNVTYNFDLIYDDDVRQFGPDNKSAGTQLRSLLSVGFSAKF